VFIIGSGSAEFKSDTTAILEILDGFGLAGYFALLNEKSKGLDAFCDKICSKIREALFCIVMLNDPSAPRCAELRVPSANVYYEFGMAVAQGKNVIPVIRRGLKLPFDVQHLDAIIYDNVDDLKKKLKKAIVATLRKKPKEGKATRPNSDIVRLIYGPLYNEIDRYLSRRDKYTQFSHNEYSAILSRHKYLLDSIDPVFQKTIARFYGGIDEFNRTISVAEKRIDEIVKQQALAFFKIEQSDYSGVTVELVGESGQTTLPTLEQILIRKIKPEFWYRAVGSSEKVIKVTYKLRSPQYRDQDIDSTKATVLFKLCRDEVESDLKVSRLRKLAGILNHKGTILMRELKRVCQ